MDASGSNPNRAKDPHSISTSPCEQRAHILVVEDNRADVYLLREAIETHAQAELHVVSDGEKAIQFIEQSDASDTEPCPALVVLDLNLPKKTGAEVLEHLRGSRKCQNALVLIVTSSDSEKDKAETTRMGANGYFRKPSSYEAFMKLGEVVKGMLDRSRGS